MKKKTSMCCLQTSVNGKNIHVLSSDLSKWKENIHVSSIGLSIHVLSSDLSKWKENIHVLSSDLSKWKEKKHLCVVFRLK
jgi:tRNA1(Val) A37 N6-methylase TrmN6